MTPRRFTPTQTFRGILQLAIAGVLIGALLFGEANLPFSVIGLCVILLLWLVIKTSAMPLLVTFQLILFFREPNRPGMEDEFGSMVHVAIVLGLLMFLSRNQSLKDLISCTLPELIKTLFGTKSKVPTTTLGETSRPSTVPVSHQAITHFRQIVFLLVCVLMSQLLLTVFGNAENIADASPSVTQAERLLKPIPPLLIITLVAVIVTSELAWRRLTVAQSSMYLRTTQVLLLYADLSMILKRQLVRAKIRFRK